MYCQEMSFTMVYAFGVTAEDVVPTMYRQMELECRGYWHESKVRQWIDESGIPYETEFVLEQDNHGTTAYILLCFTNPDDQLVFMIRWKGEIDDCDNVFDRY